MGKKAEVSAPSAVILLNKLGSLKAIKNISEKIPAPRKTAINISLIKPDMRLITVRKAVCVNPFMKKDVLFFFGFLISLIFIQ